MKFTVEYIPLSKIKPGPPPLVTRHLKMLRKLIWDCMYLLAVRKNRRDGSYTVISGVDQYHHLVQHTNKKYAPCIVDKSLASENTAPMLAQLYIRQLLQNWHKERLVPDSWSMIRSFIRQEPRFFRLSRMQQLKILLLAVRYKKTVVQTMKQQVETALSKKQRTLL